MHTEELVALKTASSVRLINFERAEVRPGFLPGSFILIVSGQAPCLNMTVALSPLIYVRCPEYWGIEVTGTLPAGFCLPALKPFVATIDLAGITGSRGIEVIGAGHSETFEVTGGCGEGSSS